MKIRDMIYSVDLLYNEWDLGKTSSKAKGKICAWIYLMGILEESERIITYKKENRLIGFCGYAKWDSDKYKLKKLVYRILKNILLVSPFIKDKVAMKNYLQNYSYTPQHLEKYFDGEISILLVDHQYRGKGIGKKLLEEVFQYAQKDNIKRLQILTDESCNYIFYEKCGCTKIYEKKILNEESDKCKESLYEMGYIYEKVLIG